MENSERHRAFFLTRVAFPYGLAQTNRLVSITTGLVHAGFDVSVICLKPTENNSDSRNRKSRGSFNQVKFLYACGTAFRGKNPFRRFYLYMTGIMNATRYLINENKRVRIRSVFIGVTGSLITLWFYIVCRILHINYLQERSEYPFIKARKSWWDKPSLFIYLNLICRLFDGFVVITRKLQQYFTPYLRKNCPVFLLPILVEPERFETVPLIKSDKYIAYCGSMQGDKDGVPVLIDAFYLIKKDFPGLKLYLIGSTQFDGFNLLKDKIRNLELELNVVFTGVADRDQLPEVLSNAVMLVLARPENKQAEGGFPTKLGEYLATGRPVVVTSVGEITDYLTDKVNGYVSRPNDAAEFAAKMKEVLLDYDLAQKVGLEGQKLTQTVFNYKVQGKLLADWLQKL